MLWAPANWDGCTDAITGYLARASPRQQWYEEYHPFGSTAWHAEDSTLAPGLKRYRYTGKEKDDETGLYYHGARFYACWLGRWCSSDPIGMGDGVNRYAYVGNRPIGSSDPSGMNEVPTIMAADPFLDMIQGNDMSGSSAEFVPPSQDPVARNPSAGQWRQRALEERFGPGPMTRALEGGFEPVAGEMMTEYFEDQQAAWLDARDIDVAIASSQFSGEELAVMDLVIDLFLSSAEAAESPVFIQALKNGESPELLELAQATSNVLQRFEANPSLAVQRLSPSEQVLEAGYGGGFTRLSLGKAVHREVPDELARMNSTITWMGQGNSIMDALGGMVQGEGRRAELELTTVAGAVGHAQRGVDGLVLYQASTPLLVRFNEIVRAAVPGVTTPAQARTKLETMRAVQVQTQQQRQQRARIRTIRTTSKSKL